MSDPRIFSEEWSYDEGVDNFEGRHPRPPGHHDGPVWDYPDRLRPPEYPFGHASRPNWQPGYVPSATEWQSWFSRKYDTDDPTLSGGPFIPLGGGVMQGPLRLYRSPVLADEAVTKAYADSLTPAGGPFVDANGKTPFTGDVTMYRHLQVAGDIYADCGLTVKQDTRLGGNLYVQGYSLLANNLDVNADVTVANVLYIGPLGARGYQSDACPPGDDERALRQAMWGFYVDTATGDRVQSFTDGHYNRWRQADQLREWVGPGAGGAPLMWLDAVGNWAAAANATIGGTAIVEGYANIGGGVNIGAALTVGGAMSVAGYAGFNGSLDVTGYAALHGGLGVNGDVGINGRFVVDGPNSIFNQGLVINPAAGQQVGLEVNGEVYISSSSSAPQALYVNGSIHCTRSPGQGDSVFAEGDIQATGNVIAGGTVLTSDARLKRDIAPARVGLEQVLQLQPKTFTRGTGGRELGLIAQDVQEVLPEAVYGTDTLGITVMPVLTALIGAVQELDRKLEILAAK